jgi:hypothetical protein
MLYENRTENGEKIIYFEKIIDAKKFENTIFCIAEMPLNSYMVYKNIIYKNIHYINNNGKMLCLNIFENSKEIEIDASENAYYLGENFNKKQK